MDIWMILLIVAIVLALSGWGYGSYYAGPPGGGSSPLVSALGVLALILVVTFIVLLATGWRFGFEVVAPGR